MQEPRVADDLHRRAISRWARASHVRPPPPTHLVALVHPLVREALGAEDLSHAHSTFRGCAEVLLVLRALRDSHAALAAPLESAVVT